MSKFEFIMMFVSVVVAFAMAELLMSWGRIIRNRHRVQQPWLLGSLAGRYLEALPLRLIARVGFLAIGVWSIAEHLRGA